MMWLLGAGCILGLVGMGGAVVLAIRGGGLKEERAKLSARVEHLDSAVRTSNAQAKEANERHDKLDKQSTANSQAFRLAVAHSAVAGDAGAQRIINADLRRMLAGEAPDHSDEGGEAPR